jgi:hypothetical protein
MHVIKLGSELPWWELKSTMNKLFFYTQFRDTAPKPLFEMGVVLYLITCISLLLLPSDEPLAERGMEEGEGAVVAPNQEVRRQDLRRQA